MEGELRDSKWRKKQVEQCYLRLRTAQPLLGVLDEQTLADVLRLLRHELGVAHRVLHDGYEELLFVLAIKRWLADKHFVQQHPEGPPVDGLSVRLIKQNLGTYVIWPTSVLVSVVPVASVATTAATKTAATTSRSATLIDEQGQ